MAGRMFAEVVRDPHPERIGAGLHQRRHIDLESGKAPFMGGGAPAVHEELGFEGNRAEIEVNPPVSELRRNVEGGVEPAAHIDRLPGELVVRAPAGGVRIGVRKRLVPVVMRDFDRLPGRRRSLRQMEFRRQPRRGGRTLRALHRRQNPPISVQRPELRPAPDQCRPEEQHRQRPSTSHRLSFLITLHYLTTYNYSRFGVQKQPPAEKTGEISRFSFGIPPLPRYT